MNNQIAAEASKRIESLVELHGIKGFRLDLVIQAAIEKATEWHQDQIDALTDRLARVRCEIDDDRAARASEPMPMTRYTKNPLK